MAGYLCHIVKSGYLFAYIIDNNNKGMTPTQSLFSLYSIFTQPLLNTVAAPIGVNAKTNCHDI